jgi:hypothetical protein
MRITHADLIAIDIDRLRPFVRHSEEFYRAAGVDHYRLLAYLSTHFHGQKLFDIGTFSGESALALSYNDSNHVHSFDVVNKVPDVRRCKRNVSYHLCDLFDPDLRERWKTELLASPLIFIDVDPHEGTREYDFVRWLQRHEYPGIIVLDDIWAFKGMRDKLWLQLESNIKADITPFGHWSGTGVISFSGTKPECPELIAHTTDISNWTLVTGYFDLLAQPDANDAIRTRQPSLYLDQAATLALDNNLMIFCEPAYRDQILSLRPKHLRDRTHVVTMSFDDFPLTKYRDKIIANRDGRPCSAAPRSTPSYYLFCMARYAMLKRAIEENPFGSTHFAWINICIERMGFRNLSRLDEALAQQRDGFSTCYIDYVPKRVVENLPEYFGPRGCKQCGMRCTMCSGFFTGKAEQMSAVCNELERQFVRCLEAGFGHSDEQLFSIVYFEHPELFDWYVGDYSEMVINYAHVYERASEPIVNLIRHSFEAQDWAVCTRACNIVWNSYVAGKCTLSDEHLAYLLNAKKTSSEQIGRQPAVSSTVTP